MQATIGDATAAAVERLEYCCSGPDCDWTRAIGGDAIGQPGMNPEDLGDTAAWREV